MLSGIFNFHFVVLLFSLHTVRYKLCSEQENMILLDSVQIKLYFFNNELKTC